MPSIYRVLTDPEYRTATYVGIYMAVAAQLAGTAPVGAYSNQIFALLNESAGLKMAPARASFYLGLAALLGSLISPLSAIYLPARTSYIGGYLIMTVLLAGVVAGLLIGTDALVLGCLYSYFCVFNITVGCNTIGYIGCI